MSNYNLHFNYIFNINNILIIIELLFIHVLVIELNFL